MKRFTHLLIGLTVVPASLVVSAMDWGAGRSHPGVLYFRGERHLQALSPEEALSELSLYRGVIIKLLYEEYPRGFDPDRLLRICTAYKRAFPDRFVLIHVNLRERLREGERILFDADAAPEWPEVFPGHWAYFPGSGVRADVAAGGTEIPVADISLYRDTDDVRLVGPGDPRESETWRQTELVRVTGIDKDAGILVVERGQRGTAARAWSAGTHALPHYRTAWGHPGLCWPYNMTRTCPRDEGGLPLNLRLARQLAAKMRAINEGAGIRVIDGFEFDVTFHSRSAAPHSLEERRRGQPFPAGDDHSRRMDTDLDGIADDTYPHGLPGWGIGSLDVCRELRRQLPDAIIIGDIIQDLWRPIPYIDGFDNESFPDIRKAFRWSGAFERSVDVLTHLPRPPVAHFFTRADADRLPLQNDAYQTIRLSLGSAMLLGIYHSASPPRSVVRESEVHFRSDLHTGGGLGAGWLGRPLAPFTRVPNPDALLVARSDMAAAEDIEVVVPEDDGYRVSGPRVFADPVHGPVLRFDIEAIPANVHRHRGIMLSLAPACRARAGIEHTVTLTLRAESVYAALPDGHQGIPFGVWVGYNGTYAPGQRVAEHRLLLFPEWRTYHLTYVPFADEDNLAVRIDLGEEPGTLWLADVTVASGGSELFYRQFENGLVLVNATRATHVFDLGAIAPGQRFRHLQATAQRGVWFSDPAVNDGRVLQPDTMYRVPPMDARFLLRQ